MPPISPRELVDRARAERRAVVAANVSTPEMARGVLRAAAESGKPVLIQFNRAGLAQIGGVEAAAAVTRAALHALDPLADGSGPRAALHLDHADTAAELSAAIDAGFDSLMIDGSTLPFDDHVELVREARGLSAWNGIPLEAELGHVAGDEEGVTIGEPAWTDPDQAAAFVQATGIDWLAVAVGNTHGGPPIGGLQRDRLAAIQAAAGIPLVLHGASGMSEAELSAAAGLGVAKINVGTALHRAFAQGLAEALAQSPADARGALASGQAAVAAAALDLLNAPWAL